MRIKGQRNEKKYWYCFYNMSCMPLTIDHKLVLHFSQARQKRRFLNTVVVFLNVKPVNQTFLVQAWHFLF